MASPPNDAGEDNFELDSEGDSPTLAELDHQAALLLGDAPRRSHTKSTLIILTHAVALTATTVLIRYPAVGPPALVLFLPVLQGAVLAGVGAIHARRNDSRAEGPINFLRREEGRTAWIVGALSSLSVIGWLWTARTMSNRAWQAIEVFLLPAIIIVQLGVPSRFEHHLSLNDRHPTSLDLSLIVVAFLVGFATLTLPPITAGALIALGRLPIEAVRLSLIKAQLGPGRDAGVFLGACAMASTACSLALWVVLSIVLPSDGSSSLLFIKHHALSISLYTLAALATLHTHTLNLDYFVSLLTPTAVILPRNLLLLVISFIGPRRVPPRGNLLQMLMALTLGTGAWLCTDGELGGRALWKKVSGWWGGETAGVKLSDWEAAEAQEGAVEDEEEEAGGEWAGRKSYESSTVKRIAVLAFVPLLVALAKGAATAPIAAWERTSAPYAAPEEAVVRWTRPATAADATVDLVIAYYDEDLVVFRDHLDQMRHFEFNAERKTRVLVYNKGSKDAAEIKTAVGLGPADSVISLPNLGREGGTYLEHILLNWGSNGTLADWTFFLQPHFATAWIADPRLGFVAPETGFLSFGPYMKNWCGADDRGVGEYPFVKELFNMFTGKLCPPEGTLTSWSAQFVVSKGRILANPRELYEQVREYIEAPEGHWIHSGWGPNNSGGPSNPVFGHALERAWPLIFDCTDPAIAEKCPDDKPDREGCQCLDV